MTHSPSCLPFCSWGSPADLCPCPHDLHSPGEEHRGSERFSALSEVAELETDPRLLAETLRPLPVSEALASEVRLGCSVDSPPPPPRPRLEGAENEAGPWDVGIVKDSGSWCFTSRLRGLHTARTASVWEADG